MTTGYNSSVDHGLQVTLKQENGTQIAPSFYYPILLNDGLGTGAAAYRTRVEDCTGATLEVGDVLSVEPGNMTGPTQQGVDALVAQDSGAVWDPLVPRPDACVGSGCGVGGGPTAIITGRTGAHRGWVHERWDSRQLSWVPPQPESPLEVCRGLRCGQLTCPVRVLVVVTSSSRGLSACS